MKPSISKRIGAVADPVIPVISRLIAANPGTISMGQGVVGYSPPPVIWDRIETFRAQPRNHIYQEVDGIRKRRHCAYDQLVFV